MKILEKPKNNEKHSAENQGKGKLRQQFEKFILKNDHPCIMAQTVFSMNEVDLQKYDSFGTAESGRKLIKDIEAYVENYDFESNDFRTFLAVFPNSPEYSETEFEKLLWKQLDFLHKADKCEWDEEVSPDPENEHFSFSLCGKAFYVVGMHPGASRKARQSPYTAIAFNLHWQFEKLREMGTYHTVRDRIRDRDRELQGDINPMLEDFGINSEARQYSGRAVNKEWKCPFHQKK